MSEEKQLTKYVIIWKSRNRIMVKAKQHTEMSGWIQLYVRNDEVGEFVGWAGWYLKDSEYRTSIIIA